MILKDFWTHTFVDPITDCWRWTRAHISGGYGTVSLGGHNNRKGVHVVALELIHGPLPDGKEVLHSCDTRDCINPDHIYAGTQLDNMRDKVAKSRQAVGEANGNSVLSEADVELILTSPESGAALARRLNISKARVSKIRRGHGWNHIRQRLGDRVLQRDRYSRTTKEIKPSA